MDCNQEIMTLGNGGEGYYDPFFVARYYKTHDWKPDECDNVADNNPGYIDMYMLDGAGIDVWDFDPTAATRGRNGQAPPDESDFDEPEQVEIGGENLDTNGDDKSDEQEDTFKVTRLHYYQQPVPHFGTDSYILEAIHAMNLEPVRFNETMYGRLKSMTIGNLKRYH